jgi:NADH-quinone oxidoreductase subunit M
MTDFPWLTTLGVIPLVGAAVIALLPKGATRNTRPVALAFSLIMCVLPAGSKKASPAW